MAIKTSTGLDTKMLDTGSFKSIMDGGVINIYAGDAPLTADAAISSGSPTTPVLLCTVSNNSTGTGITMEASAASRTIAKNSGETWSGPVSNAGALTPSFYRHVASGDDGTASTTQARVQGDIGVAGADMNLASLVLADGSTFTLTYYNMTLPSW